MANLTAQPEAAAAADPLAEIVAAQALAKSPQHPDLPNVIRKALNPEPAEVFDAAVHEVDPATGGPVWTSDNRLRRKRGRRPGQRIGPDLTGGGGGEEPFAEGEPGSELAPGCSPVQAEREARLTAGMVWGGLSALSPVWQPAPDEAAAMLEPLAKYIQELGGIGMPAWLEVAFVWGDYALRRLAVLMQGARPGAGPVTAPPPAAAAHDPAGPAVPGDEPAAPAAPRVATGPGFFQSAD